MSPDDPRHGTYAGYIAHRKDGSPKCLPCRNAERRYRKTYQARYDKGQRVTTTLGATAHHIVKSTPPAALSRATGLERSLLRRMRIGGPTVRVHRGTKAKILAAGTQPSVVGTMRRLQALAAVGWSSASIAPIVGINVDNLNQLRRGVRQRYCRVGIAERVAEIYTDLSERTPPPTRHTARTKADAARRGWAPPAAWDDIDDPNATPVGVRKVERVTNKGDDLRGEFDFLVAAGVSREQAARQFGVTLKAVERAYDRAKESAA